MNHPIIRIASGSFIAAAFFFSACSQPSGTVAADTRNPVDPPFSDISIQPNEYLVDAETADTIQAATGTSIIIPAGILVDKEGNPVKGQVKYRFREFHSAAEVIVSGVTMLYDSAGKTNSFETAGMFELTASQNNSPVYIKPGKSIEVNVASNVPGTFNFYKLDTTAGNWVYLSTPATDTTPAFKAIQAQLNALGIRPAPPQAREPGKPLLNIDIDPAMRPELAGYNNIVWQYTGEGANPDKTPGLYTTQWRDVKLIPNADQTTYTLQLSGAGSTFTTNVAPVFSGNDLKRAQEQFKTRLASWEEKRREFEAKSEEIKAYNRSVSVLSFGFANCDRVFGRPDAQTVQAIYQFNDTSFTNNRGNIALYLLADNAAIQQTSTSNATALLYTAEMDNGLIAVERSTGKVAIVKREAFKNAAGKIAKAGVPVTFVFTTIAQKVVSFADFNEVVESL
ncbi:MAG: hypothetical protein MUC87_00070 [Bacteroidia bacterium]|jgi:hypothetical protein|nr:hypothetical protein [Bacteroidia bacterium]